MVLFRIAKEFGRWILFLLFMVGVLLFLSLGNGTITQIRGW